MIKSNKKYRNRPVSSTQLGFTLLEMMIAIAIFATLSIAGFQIMNQMLNLDENIEKNQKSLTQLQDTYSYFEQDIFAFRHRAIRSGLGDETENALIPLPSRNKKEDEIKFTRAGWFNPGYQLERSELQQVHYFLKDKKLIRAYYQQLDRLPSTVKREKVLLSPVESLSFRYFVEGRWSDRFDEQNQYPQAIEIKLETGRFGTTSRQFLMPAKFNQSARSDNNDQNGNNNKNDGQDNNAQNENNNEVNNSSEGNPDDAEDSANQSANE